MLLILPLVQATQYSNCEIYGTCNPVRQASVTNINQTINNITVINGSSYNASYVPYTGATNNVDLGSYNLTANRVGIGTTTPAHTLNVRGQTNISIGGGAFFANASNRFFITDAMVNVNLTNASGTLEISSAGNVLELVKTGGATTDPIFIAWGDTSTGNTKSAERFRINRNGNVGIGTSSPTEKLDVSGNIASRGLDVQGTTTLNATFLRQATNGASQLRFQNHSGNSNWEMSSFGTALGFYSYATGVNQLYLTGTGNIGIGKTNPSYRLDVNGTVNSAGYLVNGTYLQTPTNITATYVPYVGALNNVDLGTRNLTTNGIIKFGQSLSSNYSNILSSQGSINLVDINVINESLFNSTIENRGATHIGYILNTGANSSGNIRSRARGTTIIGSIHTLAVGSVARIQQSGGVNNPSFFIGTASATGINSSAIIEDTGSSSHSNFALLRSTATTTGAYSRLLFSSSQGSLAVGNLVNTNLTITGNGNFFQGMMQGGTKADIGSISTNFGNFAHFSSGTSSVNTSLSMSSSGGFVHTYFNEPLSFVSITGIGAVAIGLPNMSVSGTGSIGLGKNVNVSGSNTFAYGVSNVMQDIPASNTFWVGANTNLTQNVTIGQRLSIGDGISGIYPLYVKGTNATQIVARFDGNISASGYHTLTDVYDTSKEAVATTKLKDSSELYYPNKTINHKAFGYSYSPYKETYILRYDTVITKEQNCTDQEVKDIFGKVKLDKETDEPLIENVCELMDVKTEVPVYAERQIEAIDLVKEVAWLRQVAYEQQQTINALDAKIKVIEEKLK